MRDNKWLGRLTLALLVAVAACSGASTSDFLPPGAAANGAAADGAAAADGETPGEAGEGAKDGGKDAARKDGSSSTTDAEPPTDATTGDGSVVDAAPDVVTGDPGIFCGETSATRDYCDVASQSCCVRSVSGNLEFACKPKTGGGSNCTGMTVPCSDTHDCNGKICCATYDNIQNGYKSVSCAQSCDADNALVTEYRLCDPDAAVDECAASGMTCSPSDAIAGWYVCK